MPINVTIYTIDKGPIEANCYIIQGDERSVLIDPCVPYSEIPVGTKDLDVIIVSHCHFDHIACLNEIKARTGAQIWAHELEFPAFSDPEKNASVYFGYECTYPIPDKRADPSTDITLDSDTFLRFLHTPGHTQGGICILMYHQQFIKYCFTGDTLFKESAGRTDIGGNTIDLKHSLTKLMQLEDSVIVLPGHGEPSTIGHERQFNPFTKF